MNYFPLFFFFSKFETLFWINGYNGHPGTPCCSTSSFMVHFQTHPAFVVVPKYTHNLLCHIAIYATKTLEDNNIFVKKKNDHNTAHWPVWLNPFRDTPLVSLLFFSMIGWYLNKQTEISRSWRQITNYEFANVCSIILYHVHCFFVNIVLFYVIGKLSTITWPTYQWGNRGVNIGCVPKKQAMSMGHWLALDRFN